MENKKKDTRWIKAAILWTAIISIIAYSADIFMLNGLAVLSLIIGIIGYISGRDYDNPKSNINV